MARQTIVIWGKHAVRLALQRAPADVLEVWLRDDAASGDLADIAACALGLGVAVQRVARATLERLSDGGVHQGVVLRRHLPRPPRLDELESILATSRDQPLLLVLDNVQDPHNLGACLRLADAAGAQAVITTRDRGAGLTSAVAKVASGAIDTVPVVAATNLARALARFKVLGLWIIGTSQDAGTLLYDCDLTGPVALVVGGEGRGLRRLTRDTCDVLACLPMKGAIESLNVATAAGIGLFEAARQRLRG